MRNQGLDEETKKSTARSAEAEQVTRRTIGGRIVAEDREGKAGRRVVAAEGGSGEKGGRGSKKIPG